MQNHYNLLYREEEREMMPLCQAEGIGVLPWSRSRVDVWRARGRPRAQNASRRIIRQDDVFEDGRSRP